MGMVPWRDEMLLFNFVLIIDIEHVSANLVSNVEQYAVKRVGAMRSKMILEL